MYDAHGQCRQNIVATINRVFLSHCYFSHRKGFPTFSNFMCGPPLAQVEILCLQGQPKDYHSNLWIENSVYCGNLRTMLFWILNFWIFVFRLRTIFNNKIFGSIGSKISLNFLYHTNLWFEHLNWIKWKS